MLLLDPAPPASYDAGQAAEKHMKLIVGLGNPGAKYARNRHNIGFMAVEQIAADHGFGPWKGQHQGSISEGRFGSTRAVLLRPETFMNKSGDSVAAAMRVLQDRARRRDCPA